MKILYFFISCLLLFILPKHMLAQTANHFSGWLGVFSTFTINKKFSLHLEGNLRSNNEWQQVQTYIFRTGLNYKLTSNQTLTAGYAFVSSLRNVNGVSGYGPEDRIWEQYSNMQYFFIGKHNTSLQNRFRLEQRFIGQSVVEDDRLTTTDFRFVQRLRYFFRMIVPLAGSEEKSFSKGGFFSIQNEVFVNLGNTSVVNGKFFDQNRAYFSLGYRFSPKNDTELGYMYQFISGAGNTRTNNNIIQLATYIRL
jgi:Protein of unknown function (DUF2490)